MLRQAWMVMWLSDRLHLFFSALLYPICIGVLLNDEHDYFVSLPTL
ncbi:hypothetical protein LINPERPRIM_LOCUS9665 [Linum perenne]